jgi:hypothetical protein
MDIVTVFCDMDDFCLVFEPQWHSRRVLTADQTKLLPKNCIEPSDEEADNLTRLFVCRPG